MPAHDFTLEQVQPLIAFANERHAIYLRKSWRDDALIPDWANPTSLSPGSEVAGTHAVGDWLTNDPILQRFKFCNVFRELDRVTVWIRENIREPYADHEHLWFMLAACRTINWPETLLELKIGGHGRVPRRRSWPSLSGFSPTEMTVVMEARKARGDKVETGAYLIRAESRPEVPWYSWSKQRYVSEIVLGRLWDQRDVFQGLIDGGTHQPSLQETWEALTDSKRGLVGWGPFMVGQWVADLRHTRYLRDAPDVGNWAPVGPGSSRGLNRLAGRPLNRLVKQEDGVAEMLRIQELVNKHSAEWVPPIELHDIQSCLCETDKYLRVQSGEGRPRALYRPNMKETSK